MSKKGKKVWERVYNERTSYLMLLPNIIMFAVFTVYPILWALRYMLFDYRGYGEAKFVGMDNFVRVFTRDPVFWDSVVNTFVYVGGKLILTLPIAFMLAFLLSKSTRINAVSQSIIFTPTIMSSAVMALIFYLLFNTYNGEINRFLMWLGVIDENINWLGVQHAMLTVIILAVWGGVGNYMVYFIAGLTGISTDVYESAKLDGANGAQTLFRITIPLLAPVLKMILMLALVISFMDMQSIMVLTEGGPMGKTNVMFLYIYQLFFPISAGSTVTQEFGYGAAVSLVAACIIGLITGLYLFIGSKLDKVKGPLWKKHTVCAGQRCAPANAAMRRYLSSGRCSNGLLWAQCAFLRCILLFTLCWALSKQMPSLRWAAVSCRKNGRLKTISTHSRSWSSVNIR